MSAPNEELVEIAARGAYAACEWWRLVGSDDDGKGRYKTFGLERMRAVEWGELDEDDRTANREAARASLVALAAKGYAVVPVGSK